MSDPTRDNPRPGDEQTLRAIDAALAAQREGSAAPADPTTPPGFYATLAGSAPTASDRFRRDLRSRLLDTYTGPAALPGDPAATPPAEDESLPWTRPQLPARPHPAAPQPQRAPARRWWVPRRAVSLAAGLAGVALLAVLLANMATLMERRNVTPTPAPTPVSAAQPALSVENLGPARPVEAAGVQHFAWSPDGQSVATAYGNNVEIWDAATGRLLHRIEVIGTTALAWSPDGRTLAAGAGRNTIHLLDPSTGGHTRSMAGPVQLPIYPEYDPYEVRVVVWSPDSSRLASISGADRGLRVWDVASATEVYSVTLSDWPWQGAIHTPSVPGTPFEGQSATMQEVSWSSDGAYLATRYTRRSTAGYEVAFWEAATGRFLFSMPTEPTIDPGFPGYVQPQPARAVDWQPGTTRAAVAIGRTTQIWDVASATQVIAMPEPSPPPLPIPTAVPTTMPPNFTPNPTVPLPVPTDALGQPIKRPSPQPYDTPTPSPTYPLAAERYDEVTTTVWSPDGLTIASIDGNHVRLWDPATGKQKHRLTAETGVNRIAWIAGGAMLAALEGQPLLGLFGDYKQYAVDATGTIRLWDANTGKQLRTILEGQVSDFYPSPTGDDIAIRSGTSVVLWTDTGSVQPTLTPVPTATLPMLPAQGTADVAPVVTPAATPEPLCGTWTIVPGPDLGGAEADLRAVAATPGSPDVWAVGYVRESGQARTLVTRWDGAQWTRVPSSNFGTGNNVLNGVAAIAPNDVWAVGYYSATMEVQQALALHWDGATWTEIPPGDVASEGSSLNAVSGSGPNDIWAVGNVGGKFTLALHWDGSRWMRTSAPSPGIESNNLLTVVALSPTEAWAAGRYLMKLEQRGGDLGRAFVLRWDGNQWKSMPPPYYASNASGLAATGPNDLWAVGSVRDIGSSGHVARWDGARWLEPPMPAVHRDPQAPLSTILNGVSAFAPGDVWAVGLYYGSDMYNSYDPFRNQPLALHWDGKQWAQTLTPLIAGASAQLQSVAAISTYDVWAVGSLARMNRAPDGSTSQSPPSPLILRYTGPGCGTPAPRFTPRAARPTPPPVPATCELAWRIVPNMAPGPLNGVVALSANEAWAVGNTSTKGRPGGSPARTGRTLVERWDGTRWAQVPSPNAGPGENVLYAVDAISSDDIWAVGNWHQSSTAQVGSVAQIGMSAKPLLMHWNGDAWRIMPGPDAAEFSTLYDVEVVDASDVWAVGYEVTGSSGVQALALHWDGSEWTDVPTPELGEGASILSGIAALAPDDIWAVGTNGRTPYAVSPKGIFDLGTTTLTLHWNGKEWTHVPSLNVPDTGNTLADVAALAPNDVWAVGSTYSGEGGEHITLHWDGKQWALVYNPKGIAHYSTNLAALAPLSTSDIWGVGSANGIPYLLHWDGARWADVQLADLPRDPAYSWLQAASVSPDGDIWAVGSAWGETAAVTLRYSRTGCDTPEP